MSVTFSSARPRGKGEVTQQTIQKMLDENHHLIQCIMDYQSKGKTAECTQYQQILHRNLVYLATIADSNQNMQSLLPAPPNPNINIGPSGLGQGAGSQSLHSQTNMNDSMGSGLPPTSLMQSQISNGPSHAPMLQQPTTSMSLPASSHGAGPGYSHSQGTPLQGQGGYSSSASRANLNMQSSQVSMMHQQGSGPHYSSSSGGAQHYQGQQTVGMMGQGNQGGGMMPQRPMGSYRAPQQGHGEYSYQQSSYGEQGYERSFDESSQHYYEGGNSQYSQQQSQYQQGSGQHQPFSQQQYPSQAGYSAQPQGYGPGQTTSSQYSQYQQGQGQQYTSYRSSSQPGPAAQSQRSYTFEQGQYGNYQQ